MGTYFVGYAEKKAYHQVSTISLVTDPDNFFGYTDGIYITGKVFDMCQERVSMGEYDILSLIPANYNREGKNWKREAYIEYFDCDGNRLYGQNIRVGIHGSYSTLKNQKGLNLFAENGDGYCWTLMSHQE